jgi:hypothetical protein
MYQLEVNLSRRYLNYPYGYTVYLNGKFVGFLGKKIN